MSTYNFTVVDSEFDDGVAAQGTEVASRTNESRTFLLNNNLDTTDNINPAMTAAWTARHSWAVSDASNDNLSLAVGAVMAANKYGAKISSSAAQINSALIYVALSNASSTVPCIEFVDAGSGSTISIAKSGDGAAITGTQSSASATTAPFVVSQAGTGPMFSGTLRALSGLNSVSLVKVVTTPQSVTNSATETVCTDLTTTLPANFLKVGTTFRGRVWGTLDSPGAGPATLRLRVYYGGIAGTVLLDTGAFSSAISLADSVVMMEFNITCLSIGGAGTVDAQGVTKWDSNTVPIDRGMGVAGTGAGNTSAITVDTTLSKDLTISMKFGSAVVGSTFRFRSGCLEILK